MYSTLIEYLDHWTKQQPNDIWLRQPKGEVVEEWSWQQASEQIHAIAAWQQQTLGGPGVNVGLLSRNRPHWFMADLGSIAAGNATVPMFTTLPRDTAEYVMDFTDMQLLFVGETENWEKIEPVLPEGITLVTLPGVDLAREHLRWDDLVAAHHGQRATHSAQADDLISIVFTSGTTGMPKGVMQSHAANIVPVNRFKSAFDTPANARLFSYLPLSHIAERQVVEFSSVING
ncbi:MAG: AMP-binding protein, partial [Pseudomonadales bacterium]|nr:AMP-binding protein [Pseudomonadales bacterium]